MDDRRARWLALWRRLGAATDGEAELAEIERRYADPGRHYHTLEHLDACLARLDELRACCERPDEAELALWLHDLVWSPRGTDDEAASAAWAEARLRGAGIAPEAVSRVAALIRATRHDAPPHSPDAAVVLDADLAILGAGPEDFDRYEAQVRAEYAHVPDEAFRAGRARILRRFLDRPSVYATAPMRAAREWAAQVNLGRSLARLES
jgi:predicted metal-dependent HD superfamily phosphohydrolase